MRIVLISIALCAPAFLFADETYVVSLRPDAAAVDNAQTVARQLAAANGATVVDARRDGAVFALRMAPSRAKVLAADPRVQSVTPVSRAAAPQAVVTETVPWSSGVSYTYDGVSNITQVGKDSFTYDAASRLTTATINNVNRRYTYDAFGNRTTCSQAGQNDCQGYTIDAAANRNRISGAGYDSEGSLKSLSNHAYSYDAANMLVRDAAGTSAREFVYDADEERIAVFDSAGGWRWTIRDTGGKVLREFTSQTPSSGWGWTRDYVYRDGFLLASRQPDGNGATSTYHYHLDHLGTPRRVTDQTDRTLGVHDYFAFGPEAGGGTNEPSAAPLKYTGHERDGAESSDTLDYMHARYYSPWMGRFLSVDPGRDWDPKQPQKWNLYAYVRDNPLTFADPTGKYLDLIFIGGATSKEMEKFLNAHLYGETANVDPNTGNVTLKKNNAAGPPTPEQKAFSDTLHAAVDRKETVTMKVTKNDSSVRVGQYTTGTVDLADVNKFRPSGAGSAASVFAHEVAEQTAKQVFHLSNNLADFDKAHVFGNAAQSYVSGYTRGATNGNLNKAGSGVLTTAHTNASGQTVLVTIVFQNGNVVQVSP